MKKGLLILIGTIIFKYAQAQTTFDKVIRDQSQNGVLANGTFLKPNGELIISGNFGNLGNGESHVSKLDSLGIPVWTRTYVKSDNNFMGSNILQKDKIIRLQDSNYLLTRNLYDPSNDKNLTYVIKFDDNGSLIWSKRLHINDASNTNNVQTLELISGKILFASSISNSDKISLTIINTNGIVEASNTLYHASELEPVGLVKDSNSIFVVVKDIAISECHVLQMDTLGNLIDSKKIPGFSPMDAVFTNDSLRILGLDINFDIGIASIHFSDSLANFQFGLGSYNSRLKAINTDLFVISGNFPSGQVMKIDLTNYSREEYYFFTGLVDIHDFNANRFYAICNGPAYGIKSSGKLYGEPQIGLNLFDKISQNGLCHNGPNSVGTNPSMSNSFSSINYTSISGWDYIMDTLTLTWGNASLTEENGCVDQLGNLNENDLTNKIQLVPNPASEFVNINTEDLIIKSTAIFGLNGHEIDLKYESDQIEVSSLPNGVYIVHISIDTGETISKKLIIRH